MAFCFLSNMLLAQLVINEYSPLKGTFDAFGNESDWVEIHNYSESDIDLSDFFLSDNEEDLAKWPLPSVSLASGSNIIFYCSDLDTNFYEAGMSTYHTNFKLSMGEILHLSTAKQIIDNVMIDTSLYYGISHGRQFDGANNWCFFNTPTPNETNTQSICYSGITPAPVVSHPSGWYANEISISQTNQANEIVVHYTTDGSIPTPSDNLYLLPIVANTNKVLSLRAFSVGQLPSKVVDRTYIFEEDNHQLTVFSIHTDPSHLWDYYEGIYVFGPNPNQDYPYYGSNFWQQWSKFSRIEVFDEQKIKIGEEHFDLEIHGGWSRAEPQKSFRLDFKSKYTGRLEYPLFESKPYLTSFNNLNLRNGGQHTWSDKIQDAIFSSVAGHTRVDYMAYEACIVYLNGVYWGVYGAREKIDEHSIADNNDLSSDELDLMNSFGVLNGSSEQINTSFDFLLNEDANSDDFYYQFSERFNIHNYIDYFIIQTYIQNMDWMGIAWGANNIKLWRPNTENGKINYVLYDTDGSFGYFTSNEWAEWENYLQYAMWPAYPTMHSELFNKVLQNNQFKCQFVNRYADLINTVFNPNRFALIVDSIKNTIYPAMNDHIDRWINEPTINGTLQSINQWESAVDQITDYNQLRIEPAIYFLNESLSLDGSIDISLNAQPLNSGYIQLNTVIHDNLPWSGTYFNQCDLTLIAKPHEGYEFLYWSDQNGFQIFEDTIHYNANNEDVLTAHFDLCEDIFSVELMYHNQVLTPSIVCNINDYDIEWYFNDQSLDESSEIINPIPGNYQLVVTSQNCTLFSNNVSVPEPLNTDYSQSVLDQFILYPNPTDGQFVVSLDLNQKQDLLITITDYLGKVVFLEQLTELNGHYNRGIDLSHKASGIYTLTISNNYQHFHKKIVVM
ncbi:MAG: CotH kinase family protein [Bacteroidota bacterium]|nr:CotH kinase family protein [Bacteroidota bacterium]